MTNYSMEPFDAPHHKGTIWNTRIQMLCFSMRIAFCMEECSFSTRPCDDDVSNMCRALMQGYEMETPANTDEAERYT